MISLSYYRLYLTLYIYFLMGMMAMSFLWDCINWTIIKTPNFAKTITALFFSINAYCSLVVQHILIEKVIKIQDLKINRYFWLSEFLKNKTTSKIGKKTNFLWIHMLTIFSIFVPLLMGGILIQFAPLVGNHIFHLYTGVAIVLMKSFMWLLTLLLSKFIFFWNKPRQKELI